MAITDNTVHQLSVPGLGLIDLSLARRGNGDSFLVLHGGAGPQSIDGFADLLADSGGACVIAPTHPGFAGTVRPEALDSIRGLALLYVALLEELALRDVTVIGNSIGGWIAAEMALLGSARIGRVVLVNATGIHVPGHPIADLAGLTLEQVMKLSYQDPDAFGIDPATATTAAQATAAANRAALLVYGGTPGYDPGLGERLSTIDMPVLVAWGDSDQIVDCDYGRAYAGAIPAAEFQLLRHAGHVPQIETPHQLLSAISAFCAAHCGWNHSYIVETDVAPGDIWATLRSLYTGTKVSANSDTIELHGQFAVGTKLTATPPDSDTIITCAITELVDGQVFAIASDFNGLMITSRHQLTPLDQRGTRITQNSTITGPRAGKLGPQIGPRITADHPEAMDDLIAAARSRTQVSS